MKVTVRYFAICRQMFNRDEEDIDLPEGAILQDVLDQLKEEKPEISELFETMQMSVNWQYADHKTKLSNNDEVALIPPVTGGSPTSRMLAEHRGIRVSISRTIEEKDYCTNLVYNGFVC